MCRSGPLRSANLTLPQGEGLPCLKRHARRDGGAAMHHKPPREDAPPMSQALLSVYVRAVHECNPAVAEHVLRALEELARQEPACCRELDQAYLLVREL